MANAVTIIPKKSQAFKKSWMKKRMVLVACLRDSQQPLIICMFNGFSTVRLLLRLVKDNARPANSD